MLRDKIFQIIGNNQGKVIGSIIGFLVAIFILIIGLFKVLFISLCILCGYYIGNKIDKRESIRDILERILPPGFDR